MNLSDLFKQLFSSTFAPKSVQKSIRESIEEMLIPSEDPDLSKLLPFPHTELSKDLSNEELLCTWQNACRPGVQPLFILADEQLLEVFSCNCWEEDELPDIHEFFRSALEELMQEDFAEMIIGKEGDEGDAMSTLYSPAFDDGEPLLLASIPAEHPWDVFRFVPFGGWNECPEAPMIAAFCKEMYAQWGVRPILVSGDMLIFKPERLPAAEEAYDLALKLYAFCPDIVEQGFESLHALADSLTKSPLWQFWWD